MTKNQIGTLIFYPDEKQPFLTCNFKLKEGENIIGASSFASIELAYPGISNHHCKVTLTASGEYSIEDLGSKNGVFRIGKDGCFQRLKAGKEYELLLDREYFLTSKYKCLFTVHQEERREERNSQSSQSTRFLPKMNKEHQKAFLMGDSGDEDSDSGSRKGREDRKKHGSSTKRKIMSQGERKMRTDKSESEGEESEEDDINRQEKIKTEAKNRKLNGRKSGVLVKKGAIALSRKFELREMAEVEEIEPRKSSQKEQEIVEEVEETKEKETIEEEQETMCFHPQLGVTPVKIVDEEPTEKGFYYSPAGIKPIQVESSSLKREADLDSLAKYETRATHQKRVKMDSESYQKIFSQKKATSVKRNTFQIMFSGVEKNNPKIVQDKKELVELGAKVIEDTSKDFKVLVMDEFKRTIKFLLALSKGVDIVHYEWVTDSVEAGRLLPTDEYMYMNKSAETKFRFKLGSSLETAKNREIGLLNGYDVYLPSNLRPSTLEVRLLVENMGGKVHMGVKPTTNKKKFLVVLNEDDDKTFEYFQKKGFSVYTTEFIYTSILQQELDLETHLIRGFS